MEQSDKKYVGAKIDRGVWNRFVGAAKTSGKSVAEALEEALKSVTTGSGLNIKTR